VTDYSAHYIKGEGFTLRPYDKEEMKNAVTSVLTTLATAYHLCVITTGQVQNLIWQRWKLLIVILVVIIMTTSGVELTIAIPAGQ
jgi:hypothetical protein